MPMETCAASTGQIADRCLTVGELDGEVILYRKWDKLVHAYQKGNSIILTNAFMSIGAACEKDVNVILEFLNEFKRNIHAEK